MIRNGSVGLAVTCLLATATAHAEELLVSGRAYDVATAPARGVVLQARFATANPARFSTRNRRVVVRVGDRSFTTRTDAHGDVRLGIVAPSTAGAIPVAFYLDGTDVSATSRLHVFARPVVLVDIDTLFVGTDRGVVARPNSVGQLRGVAAQNELVYVARGATRDPAYRRALQVYGFPPGAVIDLPFAGARATAVEQLRAQGIPIAGAITADQGGGTDYRSAGVLPSVAPRYDAPRPVTPAPTAPPPAGVEGSWSIVDAARGPVGTLALRRNGAAERREGSERLDGVASTSGGGLEVTYRQPTARGAISIIEGVTRDVTSASSRGSYRWDAIEGSFRGAHAGKPESLRRTATGNAVDLLIDGTAMLPAHLDAIRAAQRTIHVETYIWDDDRAGRAIADALVERARAGVKVRAIFDALGSSKGKGCQKALRAAGAEVVVYNPLGFKNVVGTFFEIVGSVFKLTDLRAIDGTLDKGADNRDHRKAMIVDSRVGFVGGIGFFDDNVYDWHDFHARVRGPAVRAIQRHFEETWRLGGGGSLGDASEVYPALAPAGNVPVDVITTVPGVHDELKRVYLARLAGARREILIENPYFTDDEVYAAVKSAAKRGVRTVVILPPDDQNDVKLVGAFHASKRLELATSGVDVRSYPKMTHGKVAVVDGAWCTIGSANLDNRSFTRNLEENLSIDDPAFSGELKERVFGRDIKASRPWSPADKPKGFMTKVMGFFARAFRDLL